MNPVRDGNEGTYWGGERDDTCDHVLVQEKTAEGKTSHEFSWKVKVITPRNKIHVPGMYVCMYVCVGDPLENRIHIFFSRGTPLGNSIGCVFFFSM